MNFPQNLGSWFLGSVLLEVVLVLRLRFFLNMCDIYPRPHLVHFSELVEFLNKGLKDKKTVHT